MSSRPRHLGKYELRELLGRGGMAEVWKAFDVHLQRYVAIKLLHANLQNDPDFMKRFEREARVVAGLHHHNIVQIHDFQISRVAESENLVAYMVMEYVEGQTLTSYIHSTSRLGKFPPPADIIHLFAAISGAIDYAHQQGIIHRDIKPANILLDQRNQSRYQMGEPILTDFGIVKLLGGSTATLSGGWLGTPAYISPEQAQGHTGNELSDIYSLGVALYEICTGVLPFQGDSPFSVIVQHMNVMPTSPELINPKISPALKEVILRSLAKDPAARFPTASAMAVALAAAFNMPLPANLNRPAYLLGIEHEPTYEGQHQPASPLARTPPTPIRPVNGSTVPLYSAAPPTPQFAASVGSLTTPTTPSDAVDLGQSVSGMPGVRASNVTTPVPTKLPTPVAPVQKRRRRMLVVLVAVLLLVLASSGLGTFYWLSHMKPVTTTTTNIANLLVGNATFVSTGLLNENSTQGINNELRISLANIPPPALGKSYYAWLLSDEGISPETSVSLGKLAVDHGSVQFLYPGDQQHTNLLGASSRFLITEESATHIPSNPSQDKHTWRYYATLPQTAADVEQHGKAISTLRQMLFEDIPLEALGLHGGSDIHLYINTQKVFEWADSVRDAQINKSFVILRQQIVRILAYLDGEPYVQADVPSSVPLLVDPILAGLPLINLRPNEEFTGYITSVNSHLVALFDEYGVTPKMRQLAMQADDALIGNVENWLGRVHAYAKQLFKMSTAQLALPSTLSTVNDMVAQATYAYNGRIDPSTGKLQEGVVQIHNDIQQLVTFDIKTYS